MITTKLIFDRRKTASRTREGYVEVRVTIDRMTKYISTGVRVYKNEWATDRVVNRRDAQALNDRLAIIFEKVCQAANESVKQSVKLDTESIKQAVWQFIESQSDEPTFVSWCEKQIHLLGISDGTAKHYKPLITKLTEYGKMNKWQDLTVENIANFDAWLHTVTQPISDARMKAGEKPKRLSNAAVYNYHKCLKALLNRAYKFEKIASNPYDRLKGQFKRGEKENVEYLTEDEMRKFEAMVLPEGSALDIAHDLFIFQMYTGLPYSDMQAFDISDYKWDGRRWNHVGERIKTGVPYVSSLLLPALRVLEKYDMSIPKMNNADYNYQLKALGLMAGIKTRLHSHLARHTFATYMLRNGVKIENVSKMLGHTNITQTQRYAKVLAQSVHDDFDMIAEKLGGHDKSKQNKFNSKK